VSIHIPAYRSFLPEPLCAALDAQAEGVPEVPGLRVAPGLRAAFPRTLTAEALGLVVEVYTQTRDHLAQILEQRARDRAFVDAYTRAAAPANASRDFRDGAYDTVIGARDADGRLVVGPLPGPRPEPRVQVPEWLRGEQITLFGPPDTARMSINAMNAMHRRRRDEPKRVASLVAEGGQVPRWGADDEDSKTPLMHAFLAATENLIGCFERTLSHTDVARGRTYRLADTGLSLPIKRVPGLALPDGSHLLDGNPLPLHLLDLVLHVWHNRTRPEALCIYFPKLENEEEAAYLAHLLRVTEACVQSRAPEYGLGSVRVMVVFENPRAIFRIREMAAALAPYFVGGSLGWHDFLASTARLFRHDPRYRIPVKADPNIVIHNIRESHAILVRDLGASGALKLGGMYGVLFDEEDPRSFAISMVGFVRDVVAQLKRGLDGFWIAHPDFVRIALALVQAWRRREVDPQDEALRALICDLVPDPLEQDPLLRFVEGPDVPGLELDHPRYPRGVLAADIELSPVIANDDPREVRYNLFQALQYLADWLSGNGCVALPASLRNVRGEVVPVRIMDDLATTERSRWELWAEVQHGRVSRETFEALLAGEIRTIQAGTSPEGQVVAVRWEGEAARWYPIAVRLLRQLVCDPEPPEFVTELALPFTFSVVRDAEDPWAAAVALCPGRFWTA
jgi:malate synthase